MTAPATAISRGPATLPERHRPEPHSEREAREALNALERRVAFEMEVIGHRRDWVPEPPEGALNVLVIGGGQAGLGVAFACRRNRINHVQVLDAGAEEDSGCWSRYARMHTLRSPKHMKGIELDVPSLHARCWFEARYGEKAWGATDLVPRLDWNEYLIWYRRMTEANVDFHTSVQEVLPPDADGYFRVRAVRDGKSVEYRARRIVFTLGLNGGGGPFLPDFLVNLPDHLRAHTEDVIDFETLRGKRVVVLGGGASGFDNAGAALEAGAASVEVHMRRSEVPRHNSLRWMEFPGMQEHFFELTDEEKWEFSIFNGGLPQPPTQATIWRAFDHPQFTLVKDSRWVATVAEGDEVVITSDKGDEIRADFIISATGYFIDLDARPELAHFVDDIQVWSDTFEPAENHPMGKCPYLGDGFQFRPRPGSPEYISRLFHLSTGARVSHGVAGNQLSGIFAGLGRISSRITTDITKENWPRFMDDFRNFHFEEVGSVGPHADGDPWFPQSPRY